MPLEKVFTSFLQLLRKQLQKHAHTTNRPIMKKKRTLDNTGPTSATTPSKRSHIYIIIPIIKYEHMPLDPPVLEQFAFNISII